MQEVINRLRVGSRGLVQSTKREAGSNSDLPGRVQTAQRNVLAKDVPCMALTEAAHSADLIGDVQLARRGSRGRLICATQAVDAVGLW